MGFADRLYADRASPYNSQEAVSFAEQVMGFIEQAREPCLGATRRGAWCISRLGALNLQYA